MSLTDRDRKILLMLVPVVCLLAYWFLALAPQRREASTLGDEVAKAEQRRDNVEGQVRQLETAKATFARDYAEMVRLGKAIPSKVDMPSLLVQLDQAARGTGIKFTRIKKGERQETGSAPAATTPSSGGSGSAPAASGGANAQSAPGKAAESANNTASSANQRAAAAQQSGVDTKTATSSRSGGLPVGGGATAAGGTAPASGAPGLDSVPLEFTFDGSFFDLADFFHRLKRFVRVTNKQMLVQGRLMTVDGVKFSTGEDEFPSLSVEVKATVYLSPKDEGATAGATPSGPGTTPAPSGSGAGGSSTASTTTPTATSTP